MKTRPLPAPLAALAITALGATSYLSAAPFIKFEDAGMVLENGGMKCTLPYPVTLSTAKVKGNVSEKAVSETGAKLKYANGAAIDLTASNGDVTLKLSGVPADTQNLFFALNVDTAAVAGGKWQFDAKTGDFPAEKASGQIFQGNAKNISLSPATGPGITISFPASSYQQLMDLRQFQRKEFFWQCWLPLANGTETITLKISDAGSASAPSSPDTPAPAPKAAENTKPQPDRQSYGQLGGMPPDKKTGTRIMKWKDGRQAAYLLGFDDSSPTHLSIVIPALEKHKMVGNFYINPGGTLFKQKQAQWEQAAKSPYVHLCNHTFTHKGYQSVPDFEPDLQQTNEAILAMTPHLKKDRIITFRTPGGVKWGIPKPEMAALLAKHHMVDRPWLDGPPLTMKDLPPVLATVDTALANGGTGFMDFHGVGGDANAAPAEHLTALLDKLEEYRAKFWITDTVSWFQYQDERKKSELKVLRSDSAQVRLSLTCTLDPVYYDLPLTLAVEVPAGWKQCTITQDGISQKATATGGEIRFDALPGSDEIVIEGN